MGAGVIACAEVAKAKAKPASAINLIIFFLPFCRWNLAAGSEVAGPPHLRGGCDFF
jgi:hypothetical protein